MRTYRTVSVTGNSDPIFLNGSANVFGARWAVEVPAATTVSYKLQFTMDDLQDTTWTPVWFDDAAAPATTAVSTTGTYVPQPMAIRVVVASISGGVIRLAATWSDD